MNNNRKIIILPLTYKILLVIYQNSFMMYNKTSECNEYKIVIIQKREIFQQVIFNCISINFYRFRRDQNIFILSNIIKGRRSSMVTH